MRDDSFGDHDDPFPDGVVLEVAVRAGDAVYADPAVVSDSGFFIEL
jgi:hypothetical protein